MAAAVAPLAWLELGPLLPLTVYEALRGLDALTSSFVGWQGVSSTLADALAGRLEVTLRLNALALALCLATGLLLLARLRAAFGKQRVYVLDFAVHKPLDSWRFPRSMIRVLCERRHLFSPEDVDFQEKIAYRTGLGDDTAVCPAIQSGEAAQLGIEAARFEFGATCFTAIAALLDKTGVAPRDVDYVITNSSLFNPTPSLSAAVINHFKMRHTTVNYSLGGMGCSAGVIALDLARELLEAHPERVALVVSHENITNNYYIGRDRGMLIPNVLFRSNGSAVLLTNKRAHTRRAKYRLQHVVRTNLAADDVAFNCVVQTEDAERKLGVRLNKDLIKVGADALRANMAQLGPLVLPWSEQLKYAASAALRAAAKRSKPLAAALPQALIARPYVPDFKRAFDYFCIHTGGRGIIDGLEREMALSRAQVEPSRASLYRFGNTSSTSVWYELAYIESFRGAGFKGVARGQKVWQLAFGSGFKFNSSVLVANRHIADRHPAWDDFSADKMWEELDAMEASTARAQAARRQMQQQLLQQQQQQQQQEAAVGGGSSGSRE